jgi:hypothetical protein
MAPAHDADTKPKIGLTRTSHPDFALVSSLICYYPIYSSQVSHSLDY